MSRLLQQNIGTEGWQSEVLALARPCMAKFSLHEQHACLGHTKAILKMQASLDRSVVRFCFDHGGCIEDLPMARRSLKGIKVSQSEKGFRSPLLLVVVVVLLHHLETEILSAASAMPIFIRLKGLEFLQDNMANSGG
eukprot:2372242-Amphidinium_carterae.1